MSTPALRQASSSVAPSATRTSAPSTVRSTASASTPVVHRHPNTPRSTRPTPPRSPPVWPRPQIEASRITAAEVVEQGQVVAAARSTDPAPAREPVQDLLLAHGARPGTARTARTTRRGRTRRCGAGTARGRRRRRAPSPRPSRAWRRRPGCPRSVSGTSSWSGPTNAPAAPPSSTACSGRPLGHAAGQVEQLAAAWCRRAPRRRRAGRPCPTRQNSFVPVEPRCRSRRRRHRRVEQDRQHVDQRLDVVDERRAAEQADLDGERRLVAGLAPVALDRVEDRRLLAADVGAGAAADLDVEGAARGPSRRRRGSPAARATVDGVLQARRARRVLAPQVDVAVLGADGRRRRSSWPRRTANGSPSSSTRSLNVPGSDSSALATRSWGRSGWRGHGLPLAPGREGGAAPPEQLRTSCSSRDHAGRAELERACAAPRSRRGRGSRRGWPGRRAPTRRSSTQRRVAGAGAPAAPRAPSGTWPRRRPGLDAAAAGARSHSPRQGLRDARRRRRARARDGAADGGRRGRRRHVRARAAGGGSSANRRRRWPRRRPRPAAPAGGGTISFEPAGRDPARPRR